MTDESNDPYGYAEHLYPAHSTGKYKAPEVGIGPNAKYEPPPERPRRRRKNSCVTLILFIPVCAAILLVLFVIRNPDAFETAAAPVTTLSLEQLLAASNVPTNTQPAPTDKPTKTPEPTKKPTKTPNHKATQEMAKLATEQKAAADKSTQVSARLTAVQDEKDRIELENKRLEAGLTAEVINSKIAAEHVKQTALWDGATATAEYQRAIAKQDAEDEQARNAIRDAEIQAGIEKAENKKQNDIFIQNTIRYTLQGLIILGGFFIAGVIYAIYRFEKIRRKAAAIQERKIQRANADRQLSDIYKDVDRENAIELWSLLKFAVNFYDTDPGQTQRRPGIKQITIPSHTLINSWGGAGKWKRVTDVLSDRHHLRKTSTGSQFVYGNLGDWIKIIELGFLFLPDPVGRLGETSQKDRARA